MDKLAISSFPSTMTGTAAGLFNTARIASETVGIALVGALIASVSGLQLQGAGFTSALHEAGLGLCGLAVTTGILVAFGQRKSQTT